MPSIRNMSPWVRTQQLSKVSNQNNKKVGNMNGGKKTVTDQTNGGNSNNKIIAGLALGLLVAVGLTLVGIAAAHGITILTA